MIDIITNNPFRVLGIYANSSTKEIIANKGRISAFAKVGRSVDFPLDLKGILPDITRTSENTNIAESKLALPNEKLKYSLFWFVKTVPADEVAFNHLTNGDLDMALSIWTKSHGYSSLQNRIVISIIKGELANATLLASKLYNDSAEKICQEIGCETLCLSSHDLMSLYVDTLDSSGIDVSKLISNELDQEWTSYIGGKRANQYIETIEKELNKAKTLKGGNALARLNAGKSLLKYAGGSLYMLKSILGQSNTKYQMLADKIANEILNCAIDYHNDSNDPNKISVELELVKYANSIAVGQLAKQRLSENLTTLLNMQRTESIQVDIDAVISSLKKYKECISTIANAKSLSNACVTHLNNIKDAIGCRDKTYIALSTAFVNLILEILVESINRSQENHTKIIDGSLSSDVNQAMNVLNFIGTITMDTATRARYNQNKSSLSGIKKQLDILTTRLGTTISRPSSSVSSSYSGSPRPYTPSSSSNSTSSDNDDIGCLIIGGIILIILIIIANS